MLPDDSTGQNSRAIKFDPVIWMGEMFDWWFSSAAVSVIGKLPFYMGESTGETIGTTNSKAATWKVRIFKRCISTQNL